MIANVTIKYLGECRLQYYFKYYLNVNVGAKCHCQMSPQYAIFHSSKLLWNGRCLTDCSSTDVQTFISEALLVIFILRVKFYYKDKYLSNKKYVYMLYPSLSITFPFNIFANHFEISLMYTVRNFQSNYHNILNLLSKYYSITFAYNCNTMENLNMYK